MMAVSVRPWKWVRSEAPFTPNSSSAVWPKAPTPAPPVRIKVPSMSNRTSRTILGRGRDVVGYSRRPPLISTQRGFRSESARAMDLTAPWFLLNAMALENQERASSIRSVWAQ